MTEIEQILVSLIRRTEKTILTPEGLAKEFAPKLMEAARKEIASEIDVDAMESEFRGGVSSYGCIYRLGIEDCIKVIEKGESV